MNRILAAATTATLALADPAAAADETGAYRPATKAEAAGVARTAKFPARCLQVRVPDTHEAWASWDWRYPQKGSCRTLYRSAVRDGVIYGESLTFVRRSAGRWRTIAAVSDCGRPRRVPVSVWRDLGPAGCGSS